MLVLSRKESESVVVGRPDRPDEMLKVTVLDVSSGRVRLRFEAAGHVPVHRGEVWERIRANGRLDGGAPDFTMPAH